MNISLTKELERYLQRKVASGLYTSVSEVVREGLRLLQEQDRLKALRFAERIPAEIGSAPLAPTGDAAGPRNAALPSPVTRAGKSAGSKAKSRPAAVQRRSPARSR